MIQSDIACKNREFWNILGCFLTIVQRFNLITTKWNDYYFTFFPKKMKKTLARNEISCTFAAAFGNE